MSRLFLVRHGQAGTRHNYDALSPVGHRQARALGDYFARERIHFDAAWVGALTRQRETAEAIAAAYSDAALPFPTPELNPAWNEFDLDHIYRHLAPVLAEEDPEFRAEFEAMRSDVDNAGSDTEAQVHRRWTGSDVRLVAAWIKGHPQYEGESFRDFHQRIAGCRASLSQIAREDDSHNLIVFTSGTPIGIWAALGLDVEDHRAMRLAGVLHNASYTVMRLRPDQLRLHVFNATPHLSGELLTWR